MRLRSTELSGSVEGVFWMVLSSLFYALIYVVVRSLIDSFPVNEIVFFRALLGALFMLPWLASSGFSVLRTTRMTKYL